MAKVQKEIKVCDRCEKAAATSRKIAVDGETRLLDLCVDHDAKFDRDLEKWMAVGILEETPDGQYFSREFISDQQRLRQLREREAERKRIAAEAHDAEEYAEKQARKAIPGAVKWDITPHARTRARERGFGIVPVLMAAAQPEHTRRQPWRGPDIAVHQRGDCRVVVNDRLRSVITVIDQSEEMADQSSATSPSR